MPNEQRTIRNPRNLMRHVPQYVKIPVMEGAVIQANMFTLCAKVTIPANEIYEVEGNNPTRGIIGNIKVNNLSSGGEIDIRSVIEEGRAYQRLVNAPLEVLNHPIVLMFSSGARFVGGSTIEVYIKSDQGGIVFGYLYIACERLVPID